MELYETYKERGLIVVTLLVETNDGKPPTVEDLEEWVDEYEVTHPVLSDPEWGVVESYTSRGTPALPSHTLLAPGMEILIAAGQVDEAEVEALLP